MATTEPTIIRLSKEDGNTQSVSRESALAHLAGCYRDPALALDYANEKNPAQTPFALYWPAVA